MVDNEIELDFEQLLARDLVERDITLTCVSNEVGGKYVGTRPLARRAAGRPAGGGRRRPAAPT